jgi:hypothetical protein
MVQGAKITGVRQTIVTDGNDAEVKIKIQKRATTTRNVDPDSACQHDCRHLK